MNDNQKVYDAMLIKAFRADVTLGKLWHWLKPYNINPPEPGLKRQPPAVNIRVQAFVGSYLKPLADRLWDTEKVEDIKTLYWMDNLNCQFTNSKNQSEKNKLVRKNKNDRRRSGFLANNHEAQNRNNQWNVTK